MTELIKHSEDLRERSAFKGLRYLNAILSTIGGLGFLVWGSSEEEWIIAFLFVGAIILVFFLFRAALDIADSIGHL